MLDNKEFWDQLLKSSAVLSDEKEKTTTGAALGLGYRTESKPATLDRPKERSLDIDAILADIHGKAAAKERVVSDTPIALPTVRLKANNPKLSVEEGKPSAPKTETPVVPSAGEPKGPVTNRAVKPQNNIPSTSLPKAFPKELSPDENRATREMIAAMRELTQELRQFRTQMGHPVDADHPQDIPTIPEKPVPLGETSASTTEIRFFDLVSEDYSASEEQKVKSSTEAVAEKKKTNKALNVISNVLFYVVIIAMVLGAFLLRSTSKGQPFMIGGISAANILTSSMEDVYPLGTLIITKQMDAKELKIGDDITFMVSEETSITHRIIGITENYHGTGQRAFETKGTNNPNPDKEMVAASNVVGKVIFSSKVLGDIANFVKTNWPILIFVLIVVIGLISFLKWNAKNNYGEEDEEEKKEEKSKTQKEKPTTNTKKQFRPTERRGAGNGYEET